MSATIGVPRPGYEGDRSHRPSDDLPPARDDDQAPGQQAAGSGRREAWPLRGRRPARGRPPRHTGPRRSGRLGRLVRRRTVRVILALVAVFCCWLAFSIGQALAAPGGGSLSSKLAEWARDHYLGPVVTLGEWVTYQPPKGSVPRVLLLGGASEIGLAILSALVLPADTDVIPAGRDEQRLAAAAKALPYQVRTVPYDAMDVAGHQAFVDGIFGADGDRARSGADGGAPDLVISAAGILPQAELERDVQRAAAMIEINFTGHVTTLLAVASAVALRGRRATVWVPYPLAGLAVALKRVPRPVWRRISR